MTTGSTSASGRGPVDPRVVRGSNVGYFTRQRIEHQKRVSADTRSTVGVARLSPMRPAKSMRRRLKEVFEKVATGEFVAKEDSSEKSSSSSTVGFEENLIEKEVVVKQKKSIGTEIDEFGEFEPFYEREPTLPPMRTGMDNVTQVDEKYVYDFDGQEVQKEIIDVIVDKTIQQALEEVREEEEQVAIADFQQRWHERQKAEQEKYERLEAIEVERNERTQKLIREADEKLRARQVLERKIEVGRFASEFSERLIAETLAELNAIGRFDDLLLNEAEQLLLQSTIPVVAEDLHMHTVAVEVTTGLIHDELSTGVYA